MTSAPPVGSAAAGATTPDPPDPDSEPDSDAVPAAAPPIGAGHRLRYVVVGLVLVGSLAFLLVKGLSSALNFYLPVDQALAQKATLGDQTFNLEGLVQAGSIHSTPNGVDFVVTSGSTRLEVENTTSPPQLFQAGIPVIAVGHFRGSTFVSDQILVKHSSNYIAAHPGRVTAPNGSRR